jgi:hypothetical protein
LRLSLPRGGKSSTPLFHSLIESQIHPTRRTLRQKFAAASTFGKPNAAPFSELVKAARILDVAERNGRPIEAEVQVFSYGPDLAWVALPGEIFTELGLAIKLGSPFPLTVVAELAN